MSLDVALSDRTVDLVEDGFDLALRITRSPHPTLIQRKLATTRLIVCASPGYLGRRGTPNTPKDLATHDVIAYSYWASGDDWEFDGPDGHESVRIRPRMRANNGDTCVATALQDQGVVLQPSFLVGDDLRTGRLVELLPGYSMPEAGVHAVYASRKHMPLKVRKLIDFLVEAFQKPVWE